MDWWPDKYDHSLERHHLPKPLGSASGLHGSWLDLWVRHNCVRDYAKNSEDLWFSYSAWRWKQSWLLLDRNDSVPVQCSWRSRAYSETPYKEILLSETRPAPPPVKLSGINPWRTRQSSNLNPDVSASLPRRDAQVAVGLLTQDAMRDEQIQKR